MRKKNTYSRIIQGIYNWGKEESTLGKGKMIHLLHYCVENDITSFDGSSEDGQPVEKAFGTALSESGLSRDKIQLIGKFTSEKDIVSHVENLLLNMRTDYLDLILLENPNQPEKVKNDLQKLSSQGKIMEVGGFNLQAQEMSRFKEHFPLSPNFSQFGFSTSEAKESIFEEISEEIVQMISFDGDQANSLVKNDVFEQLSEKYDCDGRQLLVSWLLNHPSHLHPVISFNNEDEISHTAGAKDISFDPVDWQKINFLLK